MQAQKYTTRRNKLAKKLNSPIILTAHDSLQARADMAHKFVQESSFLYLCGINEPNWKLIFDGETWHLVKPRVSEAHEIFDGSLSDVTAQDISGIRSVLSEDEAERLMSELSSKYDRVAAFDTDPSAGHYEFIENPAPARLFEDLKSRFTEVVDCRAALRRMRALKTADELTLQQQAIDITTQAFKHVKENLANYKFEYEIEAYFNAAFRVNGGDGHAYEPIVAGGAHACTLHYNKNQYALPENGLVLLDIGAQLHGYAADITRTYAVGKPTTREIEIHAAVKKAHTSIIELIRPGLTFKEYQKQVDEIMKDALQAVGLLKDRNDQDTYRKYFPHAIGHGLGIDVHESLGGYKELQSGMVLTVEPGIYIPEEGIGVRIEDDILVTATGYKNLSGDLPTDL